MRASQPRASDSLPGLRSASIPLLWLRIVVHPSITWNYTTWLNIVFLVLAALLVWRFLKTGGPEMLRMMNRPAETGHAH
jgi:hypothetical protein